MAACACSQVAGPRRLVDRVLSLVFALAAAFLAPRLLPESDRNHGTLDVPGAITGTFGLLGVVCTLSAWLLSGLAMVFVGGGEYADVESRLWVFAVLGTLLAILVGPAPL